MNKRYISNTNTFSRIGNVKINFKHRRLFKMILYVGAVSLVFVFIVQMLTNANNEDTKYQIFDAGSKNKLYNSTYPLTEPKTNNNGDKTYNILAIADLDTNSKLNKDGHKYSSFLLKGELRINSDLSIGHIRFNKQPTEITSQYAYGDRGMELSELVVFNGHLYSCDDRTGIVYEILVDQKLAIPWVILSDGNGKESGKGFKCEWMTIKDKKMYVGGLGKEWSTPQGVLVNHNPQWIKVIGHLGDVSNIDWTNNYNAIRENLGFSYPGYMIFESCVWNVAAQKFFFMPRRASAENYDEVLDEKRATNLLIKTDSNFEEILHQTVGEVIPTRGYSSFKFVPGTNEKMIIALKTEEDSGETRSFVTLLDTRGNILVNDILISDNLKYEGIEFV